MRRIISPILTLLLLLSLSACTRKPSMSPVPTQAVPPGATVPTTSNPAPIQQQPMVAASLPLVEENLKADNGDILVKHVYNKSLELILPEQDIADAVIIDYLNRTDSWHTAAEELYTEAKTAHDAGNLNEPYQFKTTFIPTRLDRGVFSLLGYKATHKGYNHAEIICESVAYDLTTGKALSFSDIIQPEVDPEVLIQMIQSDLKDQADRISLFEDYERTVAELFANPTNWLFSDAGLVFNYSPYEIAPYSSGIVTAIIEYNQLSNILNDAYFPSETDSFNGKLLVETFDMDKIDRFSQIAEVTCSQSGTPIVLYTDSLINSLRIDQLSEHVEDTVFVSQYISPGDGIVLYADVGNRFKITYVENGNLITQTLSIADDGTPQLSN